MSPRFVSHEDDRGTRTYVWRGRGYPEAFYSVTSLIDLGVPKYLVPWAAKAVAEVAYEDVRQFGKAALERWEQNGRQAVAEAKALELLKSVDPAKLSPADFALRWLKGAPDRLRDHAADIGVRTHAAAEEHVLSLDEALRDPATTWPEDIRGRMQNAFLPWLEAHRPRYEATEATVFSRTEQFGGTLDALVWLPTGTGGAWELWIVDYKSGRRTYPTVGLQLAAYAHAEFIGGPDGVTEIPMPPVAKGAVLHLTDKGHTFREIREWETCWRVFRHAREVARFQVEISKRVLGEPVEQNVEAALAASLERVAV